MAHALQQGGIIVQPWGDRLSGTDRATSADPLEQGQLITAVWGGAVTGLVDQMLE